MTWDLSATERERILANMDCLPHDCDSDTIIRQAFADITALEKERDDYKRRWDAAEAVLLQEVLSAAHWRKKALAAPDLHTILTELIHRKNECEEILSRYMEAKILAALAKVKEVTE